MDTPTPASGPANSETPPLAGRAAPRLNWRTALRSIGPAMIVAAVVLGPGSITTASKVGCRYGYSMGWVMVATTILMIAMTLAALLIGLASNQSAGDRMRGHFGGPATVMLGFVVFAMVVLFQSSNNTALLLAAEIAFPDLTNSPWIAAAILIGVNALIVFFFFSASSIYKVVERSMLSLVAVMLICFGINAVAGGLDFSAAVGGLVPSEESVRAIAGSITGDLRAMIATTFSVAGAFYQCYLVRERGWTAGEYRVRWIDSVVGIATLGFLTWLIMGTAAASLHGRMQPEEIQSLVTLAASLRPTFGPAATAVFAGGILAGAISSFVGNALIGGTIFSDCLGFGAAAKERGPRMLTVAALLVGMVIALVSVARGIQSVAFIVMAQGLTTLGLPLMACLIFYLLRKSAPRRVGLASLVAVGVLVSFFVATATAMGLISRFTEA